MAQVPGAPNYKTEVATAIRVSGQHSLDAQGHFGGARYPYISKTGLGF